jgi:hypothetical protein
MVDTLARHGNNLARQPARKGWSMASVLSHWSLAAGAAALIAAIPAGAAPLSPVDAWTVDYGETQCAARRSFGADGRTATLTLRPAIDGSSYEVWIADGRGDFQIPTQVSGRANFGGGAVRTWVLKHRDPATSNQVYRFRVPADEVARAEAGSVVAFSADAYSAQLDGVNLRAAVTALGACLEDLRAYWKPGSASARPAAARENLESLLRPANHEDSGMWGGVRGSARYVLFIDPAGKLAGCEAVSEDASPILAVLGCSILRERAQFSPALDQNGEPARGLITTSPVRWDFG